MTPIKNILSNIKTCFDSNLISIRNKNDIIDTTENNDLSWKAIVFLTIVIIYLIDIQCISLYLRKPTCVCQTEKGFPIHCTSHHFNPTFLCYCPTMSLCTSPHFNKPFLCSRKALFPNISPHVKKQLVYVRPVIFHSISPYYFNKPLAHWKRFKTNVNDWNQFPVIFSLVSIDDWLESYCVTSLD